MAIISVRQWFRTMRAAEVQAVMTDARLRPRIIWFRGTARHQDAGMPFIGPIRFDAFLDVWQFVHEVCDCQPPDEMRWADLIEAAVLAEAASGHWNVDPLWIGADDTVH